MSSAMSSAVSPAMSSAVSPGMSSAITGAVVAAACCALLSPYLAVLARRAPDRSDGQWWRWQPKGGRCAVLAALLGALAGAAAGCTAALPAFVALAAISTPLVLIDVAEHRLPNRLVFAAAVAAAILLSAAAAVHHDGAALLRVWAGGAAVFAGLFALAWLAPESFGFGDVKLGGVLGGYLGWFGWAQVYCGMFAGFLLGALVAVALVASRRATLSSAVAFGPMLIVGALAVPALGSVVTP